MTSKSVSENEKELGLNLLQSNDNTTSIPQHEAECSVSISEPIKTKSTFYSIIYRWRGMLFALIASIMVSFTNILVKKCKTFNGSEIIFIRFIIQISILLPIALAKKLNILGDPGQRIKMSVRGIFGTMSLLSLYFAVSLINPSDAVALVNSGVIFVTIFARIFLKEKLTIVHLVALLLTVFGIVFISQPSFLFNKPNFGNQNQTISSNFSSTNSTNEQQSNDFKKVLGFSLSLLGALSYTTVSIVVKELVNQKAHLTIILLYAAYYGLPVGLLMSIFLLATGLDKRTKTILTTSFEEIKFEIVYVLLIGILSVSLQVLLNVAMKLEDAGKVSLFKSTDLVFVFLLQYIILGIYPNLYSTIGAISIFTGVILIMIYKIIDNKHEANMRHLLKVNDSKIPLKRSESAETITCLKRSRSVLSGIFFYKF